MEPAARKWTGRGVLTRALLLGVAALRLLYGAFVAIGGGWPLYPPVAAVVGRRTYVQAALGSPEAWRSREWRKAVNFHAAVLAGHLADGLLTPSSRAVCLGGAQEALALRELGVPGAVAVAKKRSPPLVFAGDDRRLHGWRRGEVEKFENDEWALHVILSWNEFEGPDLRASAGVQLKKQGPQK